MKHRRALIDVAREATDLFLEAKVAIAYWDARNQGGQVPNSHPRFTHGVALAIYKTLRSIPDLEGTRWEAPDA